MQTPTPPPEQGLVLYKNTKRSATRVLPESMPTKLRFMVRENGAVIEFPLKETLIIGRKNSTLEVDIDLNPHEGMELGVSRQHVKLQVSGERLMVSDMNSVNGTRLNGATMTPTHVYQIQHGDELKLGRLHLRVFFVFE